VAITKPCRDVSITFSHDLTLSGVVKDTDLIKANIFEPGNERPSFAASVHVPVTPVFPGKAASRPQRQAVNGGYETATPTQTHKADGTGNPRRPQRPRKLNPQSLELGRRYGDATASLSSRESIFLKVLHHDGIRI